MKRRSQTPQEPTAPVTDDLLDPRAISRETLVAHFMPSVRQIARKITARLPGGWVESDDVLSAGLIGLLDARNKFDPARGRDFRSYAEIRIRGAMLDELRHADWMSRRDRQRSTRVSRASRDFEHEHERAPTSEELAVSLGLDVTRGHSLLARLGAPRLVSIDDPRHTEVMGQPSALDIPDASVVDPLDRIEYARQLAHLRIWIERLSERQRVTIKLHYFCGLPLKDIAALLRVTESRVSQLHTAAVARLRALTAGGLARSE